MSTATKENITATVPESGAGNKIPEKRAKLIKALKIAIVIVSAYIVVLCVIACFIDGRHAEIEINGSKEIHLEYGATYTDEGAVAYSRGRVFGQGKKHPPVTVSGKPDTGKLGEYEIKYSASLLGKETVVTRKVIVEDTTPPVINLGHRDGYSATWFDGYDEEGFSATDNVDGDVTASVIREENEDTVTYTVTDSSGNTSREERRVNYAVTAPILSLRGEADMIFNASQSFEDPGCSAIDTRGNDLSEHIVTEGSVTPWLAGTYEIVYSITNQRGDSASIKRNVTVNAVSRPDIVKPSSKTIFLTFDDGPSCYTAQLLDVLDKYNVKATFFVTCLDTDYTYMIGEEYRRGHSVGVHTYSHNYYDIYSSEQAYFYDFNTMEDVIYQQTGSYTSLMRFPGGSSNTVSRFNEGIMTRLTHAFEDMGYRYFDWNVSSGDAGETTDTEKIIKNIQDGCENKTACIVLQHDNKDYSIDAVEQVIIWGLENGYNFASLNMTSYDCHHGIAN